MKAKVHIKQDTYIINCGTGNQEISWIGDVAIVRYEHFYPNTKLGICMGIRQESGDQINMKAKINETLFDGQHVWILLKEDVYEAMFEENQ